MVSTGLACCWCTWLTLPVEASTSIIFSRQKNADSFIQQQRNVMPWSVGMYSMANEVFGGLREECERFVEGRTYRAPAHFINPSSRNMIFQYLP